MKRTESDAEIARIVRELAQSEDALAKRVHKVGRGIREPALVVGISHFEASRCVTRGIGEHFPAGCLMKLLTGALVMQAVAKGQLKIENKISDVLGGSTAHESLDGVTIRHLLEHTHGLDCIENAGTPLRDDGFIDAPLLCRLVTTHPPLARPGLLYSYGNHGTLLLAAVLEHAAGMPFSQLLLRELFVPLGVESNLASLDSPTGPATAIHPSVGGPLTLTASGILQFLRHATSDAPGALFHPQQLPHVRATVTPLPGWNSTERGIHLGWKDYGSGWFGHNSIAPDAPSMVRIHPERKIAVVVATSGYSPPAAALELFGEFMPSLAASATPAPASASEPRLPPEFLCGTYTNANFDLHIAPAGNALEVHAVRPQTGESAEPFHRASLRRAANNLYFVMPPSHAHFPFLQFIRPTSNRFEYLWNGERVWRNRSP